MRKAHEEEIVVGEDSRLVLVPSAFIWPHIALVQDPPDRLGLVYPAPFASHDVPAELPTDRLLPVLRALANDTRLRTLKLIAQSPRSTQELALLLGITEAGLSKHLRQLTTAGIVETHRRATTCSIASCETGSHPSPQACSPTSTNPTSHTLQATLLPPDGPIEAALDRRRLAEGAALDRHRSLPPADVRQP